ncbi:unnamed protein product [Meganyctiphanes norvegica]|uniref:Nuclear pore complex protein Nup153 n=1 Tax=Meganyctiphanes norvegica TaxID=48144 RepID=A0AAV2Q8Z7_MEGNR
MAADGPGKYKGSKRRIAKPYDRPQGIFRRVTDSVTGLFGSLSGWLGADEDGTEDAPTAAASAAPTSAPPGESFIFAQPPTTHRKPYRPIYPEEGEDIGEGPSSSSSNSAQVSSAAPPGSGINLGATSSSIGPTSIAPTPLTRGLLGTTSTSLGHPLPLISSTPYDQPLRTRPLMRPTPTSIDSGSESPGTDFIMPPRRVALDEETFTSLRMPIISEANKTSSPSANAIPSLEKMSSSPVNAMPSLEETQRKRGREIDTDHNSSLGGDSISNRSLFSETGSRASHPQMPASSKKPRFNVSAFSTCSAMGDRSVLSDSTSRPSPFYPWRTAYGGASANKRNRYQNRLQTNRAQIKPKPPPSDSLAEDGGLSQAARRILDCLNNMSTPISDAKRIPTPSPGQRGSFLDSSYTATYYKHRPPSRNSGPPVTKLLTPTKAVVQPNLSKLIGVGTSGKGSSSTVAEMSSAVSTTVKSTQDASVVSKTQTDAPASKPKDPPPSTKPSQDSSSLPKQQEQSSNVQTTSATSASFVSKPATVTEVISKSTTETSTFSFKSTTESSSAQPPFRLGESNISTESASSETPLFRFGNVNSTSNAKGDNNSETITSRPSIHASEPAAAFLKGGGGKLKTKINDTGRASRRDEDDDETPVPVLPAVSLSMSTLPKINFSSTQINAVIASSPQPFATTGFTFSAPQTFSEPSKASLNCFDGAIASNELEFTFSTPQNLLKDSPKIYETPGAPMFNSISTNFQPKLKASASKSKLNAAPLKEGSILDVLKSNKLNASLNEENSVSCESNVATTNTNSLEAFMKKSDEWNCDTCMVTNKNMSEKCVSCETPKPGASTKQAPKISSNLTSAAPPVVTNSLSAFIKRTDEWSCDTCMLTNKSSFDKCAACETPKPGTAPKTSAISSLPLSSSNSIFSSSSTFNAPVGFNFQKSSSEWECSECLVRNKDNADTCVCCSSAKPGSTNTAQSSVFSSSNNSLATNTEWKCETCLVQNTKDSKKCKECDTAKPSAVIGSQVITGNFKFGVGNTSANDSSSGGFKFGISNSSVTEAKSSGFSFGVNSSSVNKDSITSTTTTGFSFGIKASEVEKSDSTKGFKFGENSIDSKNENGGGFAFGIPQKPTEEKTEVSSKSELSFSNADSNKKQDKADSVTEPAFSFGSAPGGFTFGGNANGKKIEVEKSAKEENSSVDAENNKESEKPAFPFSFGSKPTENDVTTSQNPAFSFSNSTSKDTSSTMVNSSETFSFGTPKSDEKLKTSAPTFTFGSKPTESASLTFGGNTMAPKVNAAAAVPTTNSTFTFGSVVATTKEETKSPFGGKRDSSSCDEPARKLPFGTSNTAANSGMGNSTTSLFTFGTNNSQSGPGFGASPASNAPAFGSPAPVVSAANPTPSFSFNSTAPATTPAFGAPVPTPMFGQGFGVPNNNNNNPSFAFGQPSEKKASTGFDFGGVTANSPSPAFNFATSAEPASGPGLFQFGQSAPNNTSTGGSPMFQFGSGAPTATPTPAFGAGGDNIFSAAGARTTGGQPDRRIKKKAVRRIPK